MNHSETYRAAFVATHSIHSTLQRPRSAVRALIQRLCLTLLAGAIVMGATNSARAAEVRDEAAVRDLGGSFAKAFVEKNAEARASLFAENGTFVTPQGHFLAGRVAMVNEFGPEAQQAVNGTTQAEFSDYRIRFIKPDVATVDAILTVHNVNGPDGQVIPAIPINFFYVALRRGDHWLIEDGRAHFALAPANAMTSQR